MMDVPFDVNLNPSSASCCVLVPGAGHCPDLVKRAEEFLVPGNIHILVPVIIPTFTLYNSLAPTKWRGDPFCLVATQS